MNKQSAVKVKREKVQFGFLGSGQIASYSATAIHSHPQARVVAAQDLSQERVDLLCKEHQITKGYLQAEALLADPEVDAVYIAVPNKFHVPMTMSALEAGKHVILEKPFAMNYREASEAAALAEKKGLTLTLGMNQRFAANPQKIKTLVEDGKLGEIYHAKGFWLRRRGIPKLGTWFGSHEMAGGGSLYDIGVHMLDLTLYLMGNFKPVSVFGSTYTKFGNRGLGEGGWGQSDRSNVQFNVDDFSTAMIRFENGATASLDAAWACHTDQADRYDVHLYGTEAGAHAVSGQVFRESKEGDSYIQETELKVKERFPHQNRFHNFINYLKGTEDLCVTLEEALTVQKILDAIAESSRTGHEVRL